MHYFIERMMSKDKDLRYSTPHELVDDINEQIDGFRSLEYRPEEGAAPPSNIMRAMGADEGESRPRTGRLQPPSTTRRIQPPQSPPSTRRIATLDDLKKRLKRK
jgi:hypothetical protein